MQQVIDSRVFRASWSHPNSWPQVIALVVGGLFATVGTLFLFSARGSFSSVLTMSLLAVLVGGVGAFSFITAMIRIRKTLSYSVLVNKDGVTINHGDQESFFGIEQVRGCRHERVTGDGNQYSLYLVHSEGEEQIDVDALTMEFADIKHFDELIALHSSGRYRSPSYQLSDDELKCPAFIRNRTIEDAFYADQNDSGS